MDLHYQELREAAEVARQRGHLTEAVKLVMMGRLTYAAQRGDVDQDEHDAIAELLGAEFFDAHQQTRTIAEIGATDDDLVAETDRDLTDRLSPSGVAAA